MCKWCIGILVLIPILSFGQMQSGDWTLGITYDHIKFQGFNPKNAVGATSEWMLGKHVGIQLSIAGGKDYLHFGSGALFFPIGLLLSTIDDEGGFFLLLASIGSLFEHTNYHIPVSQSFEIVPYVSLLRFRYIYDKGNDYNEDVFPAWSVGTKLSLLSKSNWYLNTQVEYGQLYYTGRAKGLQWGLNGGYIFKNKAE